MSEIKYQKLDTLLRYLKKSKIKAGEGKEKGEYPFYTSSAKLTKRIDIADYKDESIVLGTGGLASIHYVNQLFSTSTDCFVLIPIDENIDLKYIYYYLKSNIRLLEDGFKGVGLKHISKKYLSNIKIPIQSLGDQRKISTFLTRLEKLIEKRQESIKLLDKLIKSTFLDMFGDPVLNTKGWDKDLLLNLTDKIGSGSTPRGGKEVYLDKGYYFIRSQNVRMNKLIYDTMYYIDETIHNKMKNTWVKNGDVLLNITGASIGRVAYFEGVDNSANVNQHVSILRPKHDKMNYIFLSYCISQNNFQKQIMKTNVGGTREAFNFSQIKKFNIIIPPKPLQDKFVEIVTKIETIKKLYQNSLDELTNLFNSTAQKAFKGELDVSKIELEQTEQKEAATMLDKEKILELIKRGDFDPKDYVTSEQSYDDIRDIIIGTKGKIGLIDDGLVVQQFDKKLKKMVLKVKE